MGLWGSDIHVDCGHWIKYLRRVSSALFCLVKTYLRLFQEQLVPILLMHNLCFIHTDDRSLSFIQQSLRTLTRPDAGRDCCSSTFRLREESVDWRVLRLTWDLIGWILAGSCYNQPFHLLYEVWGVQTLYHTISLYRRWVLCTVANLLREIQLVYISCSPGQLPYY